MAYSSVRLGLLGKLSGNVTSGGYGGHGGSGHLANEMLSMLAGIKTQHIPYKGAGPALVDLIGGQVQMFIDNPLTVIAHINSGRLRAMAITGETRVPALPQVPKIGRTLRPQGRFVSKLQNVRTPTMGLPRGAATEGRRNPV